MKKIIYFVFISYILIHFSACVSGYGELTGRKTTRLIYNIDPNYGMVQLPGGSFTMGANDQDVPYANRSNLKTLLNINSKRNILDPEFWNYNLIVDNYSKNKSNNFERSFTNLFILTKNNKLKNSDLKVYFIKNYNLFSESSKKNILKNFKVN